jgi:glutathione synthase
MRIVFLVNDPTRLGPRQTTTLLVGEAVARDDCETHVCGVTDLVCGEEGVVAHARMAPEEGFELPAELVDAIAGAPTAPVELGADDLLVVRTNPARDRERWQAHRAAMAMCALARDRQGTSVVNDPDALHRASTKLYLSYLPAHLRPRTLVSHDAWAFMNFIDELEGPCVIKPIEGTRGEDVFLVEGPEADNLPQILEVLTRRGYALAQEFVPEAVDGDTRILVLDGAPLEIDGYVAAVRRVPPRRDFRSNVHVGGTPARADLDDRMRAVASEAAEILADDGIRLAGLDLIGDKIIEVNVFSAGGLHHAEEYCGVSFSAHVLDRLLER